MDRIEKFTYNGQEYLLGPDSVTIQGQQTITGEKTFLLVPSVTQSTPFLDEHVTTVRYTKDNFVGLQDDQNIQGDKKFTGKNEFTQKLTLSQGDPTQDLHAQTKQYVDQQINSTLSQVMQSNTPLGVDQKWENVTNSRQVNITYKNKTGRTIAVMIHTDTNKDFYIDGFKVNLWNEQGGFTGIIPNNSTFKITGNFKGWYELKEPGSLIVQV